MANIVIAGQAVVVTSTLRLEDIKTIKKYRPTALILRGGEDGKEPIFALDVGEKGSMNRNGACFNQATRNPDGLANLTLGTEWDGYDVEEQVADALGAALTSLNKLESALPDVLREIEAEKAAILGSITVVQ